MATPKPKPKGITVALGGGVTMDAKTGKKTTKPKALPSPKSNKQYFADQKKFVNSRTKNK